MTIHSLFNTFIVLIFLVGLGGCRTAQPPVSSDLSLPSSFGWESDTTSLASLDWREYFTDPHLRALIDSAIVNNFDVRAAWERVEAARSSVLLHRGLRRPSAEVGLWASQQKFGRYTMDGAGNLDTDIETGRQIPLHLREYAPQVEASWEVDIWGKLRNRKQAALNRFLASQEGRNVVVTALIAEVATRYYELIGLDTELATLNETIALQENALRLVTLQKEAAAANELAVRQFEAQVLNSKSRRSEVRQQIIEHENHINFLLGRWPQPIPRDSLADAEIPPAAHAGLPAALLLNRPDIREAERELYAAKADVQAARAAFYPALNLSGAVGFQAYKPSLLFLSPESFAYGMFGSLTAPLFNRSALRAELQFANAQQREALINYERAVVNSYTEVVNHLAAIHNLGEAYQHKAQEADALWESINTSSELFRTGRATYLDVIITQQHALQARLELINIRERQLISAVNLYRALGGGWK